MKKRSAPKRGGQDSKPYLKHLYYQWHGALKARKGWRHSNVLNTMGFPDIAVHTSLGIRAGRELFAQDGENNLASNPAELGMDNSSNYEVNTSPAKYGRNNMSVKFKWDLF